MSERGGQDVPGSADLLALYNRKRALESKYEKKDDLVKELEALEEEKEALDKEAARIAQQRPIVDDKCKTRQAQLAQVSTDCESDEADLQRSWRIIFAGNAGRPSSQHPPNPLPTSNDKSTEDVQDPSQQSRQSKLNEVEENAAAGPATRTGRISKPPPRYSPTPPATNPTRASPNASTNNVMAAARRLSSQPSHRTMADNTPTNSRAKRNQQLREEDPEEVSGHVQKRRKTTAAAQELYTVDISRPRPVLWKEEVAADTSRLATRAEAKERGRKVITHPLEGKPYRAYWRSGSRGQGWYALIVLPLGNFDAIGLHGSFLETELAKSIPSCYERHDSTVFQWAEGYRDGERLVTKRKFPVMWIHEGQTFPLHKDLMMPTPAWYNWLPAPDLRPFSADCASDGNNLIRGYNSAVEYAEQVGRIKAASQRHTVGFGGSLTEITGLPSGELVGENTTGEEHEHEKSVSADDGTSAGGVLAIVSDTAIESPRDNNEGEDGDCANMNLRCIRQPNMVMNPNTISGSHHRRNSLVEQSIIGRALR
ncbi:hypothetical protein PGQ11_009391 [Apiospora arundinis]|uniref:Uncharacterized protein n=1 Tax=Apiospora arundinis TaxID=335852 RepID=A0ABR2IHU2_9PEZI